MKGHALRQKYCVNISAGERKELEDWSYDFLSMQCRTVYNSMLQSQQINSVVCNIKCVVSVQESMIQSFFFILRLSVHLKKLYEQKNNRDSGKAGFWKQKSTGLVQTLGKSALVEQV